MVAHVPAQSKACGKGRGIIVTVRRIHSTRIDREFNAESQHYIPNRFLIGLEPGYDSRRDPDTVVRGVLKVLQGERHFASVAEKPADVSLRTDRYR